MYPLKCVALLKESWSKLEIISTANVLLKLVSGGQSHIQATDRKSCLLTLFNYLPSTCLCEVVIGLFIGALLLLSLEELSAHPF